jgi:hypothetical protein
MTIVTQQLHLLEYEVEQSSREFLDREEEPVIDDAEVARLLMVAAAPTGPAGLGQPLVALDPSDSSDGLSAMRGLLIGFAWVAPFWLLVVTILLLA